MKDIADRIDKAYKLHESFGQALLLDTLFAIKEHNKRGGIIKHSVASYREFLIRFSEWRGGDD